MTTVIQKAVEDRQSPARVEPMQLLKAELNRYQPVIAALLPTSTSPDRFKATIANAIRKNPDLLKCELGSIVGAALRAAQLGLEPNDNRNLCFLVPYGKDCQFQLGYGGILELLRRAIPGTHIDGRAVYPGDEFDIDYGLDQPIKHRPAVVVGRERGGDAIAWYVRVKFPDGTQQVHVLDRAAVEYHRGFSKQANGTMWSKSYDAAALKSVVHDMRRWLPQSVEIAIATASDEQVLRPDEMDVIENSEAINVGVIEHRPAEDEQ